MKDSHYIHLQNNNEQVYVTLLYYVELKWNYVYLVPKISCLQQHIYIFKDNHWEFLWTIIVWHIYARRVIKRYFKVSHFL